MSRCKACDRLLGARDSYKRTVRLSATEAIQVEEDLCRKCRAVIQEVETEETFLAYLTRKESEHEME